jgi:hypothetical protein
MSNVLPKFSTSLVTTMNLALEAATGQVAPASRNSATIAKMAQSIVRSASAGTTDTQELIDVAVAEGREPAH